MEKGRTGSSQPTELRKRAEARLEREGLEIPDMQPEEARKLVHELQTHQIELEMQNEELRRAQEELVESRDRYSDLYDFAPVGYVTVSHKGLILEANLTLAGMLGVERGALVKQRLSAFILPDDQDIYYRNRREILEAKQCGPCRLRMLRRGAEPLWVEMDSIRIVATDDPDAQLRTVINDITERKMTEAELTESEARSRAILETARDAIITTDRDGAISSWNQAAEGIFGHRAGEALGCPITAIIPELFQIAHKKGLARAQTSEGLLLGGKVVELCGVRRDGTEVPLELSLARWQVEEKTHFTIIVRSIAERKRIEDELRQSHKLEAVGTLAGGIAHDFNNILGAIIGYTELALGADTPPVGHIAHCLHCILESSERASELVKHIMMFSRRGERRREPVPIVSVTKEALRMLEATLPSTIEIGTEITCATNALILGDATQIHQIIINLCTNAFHAMEETGGRLKITLSHESFDSSPVLSDGPIDAGEYFKLTVGDTGHGMSREVLDRIFEPFFTTKATGRGTGMGLSVVHGIVKGHEGAVTVDSQPGKGTTFEILLPEHSTEAELETAVLLAPVGGNERILFVDDEKSLTALSGTFLQRLGYAVEVRSSGTEALKCFLADPMAFDLVITDQTMPRMTGGELAAEILRIRPDIPVILCTGHSEAMSKEKAHAMGVREFMMKPVRFRSLAEAIRRLLDPA